MAAPIVVKPVPMQSMNELAAYGPFDLSDYIEAPDGSALRFQATLASGESLPKGLICASNGLLTGIPAKQTSGQYQIEVTASNADGTVSTQFILTINPGITKNQLDDFDSLKSEVWLALENNLPVPDLMEAYGRPITIMEIYYLLERWSAIKIWDVFNLEAPGELVPLNLKGMSEHYLAYDRGSCLVATPKDLFSHERTLEDGLQTARVLAQEAYNRRWSVELVGFEKLTRAAWLEIQRLSEIHGWTMDVINYQATSKDIKLHFNQNIINLNRRDMET